MASIDFDSVLDYLGAEGRYQTVLYYLLCIPATVPAAFLAFNQVFMSATPSHWCQIPELANLTVEDRKALGVPFDGKKYSECTMYHNVDYSQILPEGILNGNWSSDINSLSFPTADSTWPITKCLYGWEYDKAQYDATLVTEVIITIIIITITVEWTLLTYDIYSWILFATTIGYRRFVPPCSMWGPFSGICSLDGSLTSKETLVQFS